MGEEIQSVQKVIEIVIDFFVSYSFQVAGAIIVLFVGWMIARYVSSFTLTFLEKKGLDITLSRFLSSMLKFTIIGFVLLIALGKFGVTVAPFIAALAAMAFGASFAIQGPLSNYGAGLVIVFTRPFVIGNTITVAGVSGVVEDINLGTTVLSDEDGVKITIPNKHIVGEIIKNSEECRIVEEIIGVNYDCDIDKALGIVEKTLNQIDDISKAHPNQIGIQKFNDSSIDIGMRYWVRSKNYFPTLYKVNYAVFNNLTEGGIEIPFPQRDVHIISKLENEK